MQKISVTADFAGGGHSAVPQNVNGLRKQRIVLTQQKYFKTLRQHFKETRNVKFCVQRSNF